MDTEITADAMYKLALKNPISLPYALSAKIQVAALEGYFMIETWVTCQNFEGVAKLHAALVSRGFNVQFEDMKNSQCPTLKCTISW